MSGARRDPTAAANSAVTLMKQAVEAASEHGDINIEVVCKAVEMSRSQMQTWLASRAPSAQWDTKLAEWLKSMPLTALPSDDLVLDLAACNSIRGVLEGALERDDAASLRGALAPVSYTHLRAHET